MISPLEVPHINVGVGCHRERRVGNDQGGSQCAPQSVERGAQVLLGGLPVKVRPEKGSGYVLAFGV